MRRRSHLPIRLWLLALTTAFPLAQSVYGQGPGDSTVRGELVRFPDARVNVSVFVADVESIPSSLWDRISRAGNVAFFGGGSPEVNETVRSRTASAASGLRVVDDPSNLDPVGVQVTESGQIRLAWYGTDEEEGVRILADARAADDQFSLRILIPNPTETDDWWGLQARLSQVGIRRVQILSGDP